MTQLFLGLADNSWSSLVEHLEQKRVPLALAVDLGLVKSRESGQGHYDFFRNRLVFPIVSPRGEVLGFGGRTLEEGEEGVKTAKYINSPDSPIYHKSNCVYGLDVAAAAIRNADQAILVEGYMDLAALHQAGLTNVVAPLGTALTAGHLRLLVRYTRNLVLNFDGDEAGTRATLRVLPLVLESGLMPRVVELPQGEDPDSIVRKEGVEAFRARLEHASSLFEFFIERTLAKTGFDAAGKAEALKQIVPLLKQIVDPVERGVWREHLARRMDVDGRLIADAGGAKGGTVQRTIAVTSIPERTDGTRLTAAERILTETMLKRPATIGTVFTEIEPDDFEDPWCRTVVKLLHDAWRDEGDVRIGELMESLGDAELAGQIRAVAMDSERCDDEEVEGLVVDCIRRLKSRPLAMRMERINEDIRHAEAQGDDDRLLTLMEEKRTLAAQLQS